MAAPQRGLGLVLFCFAYPFASFGLLSSRAGSMGARIAAPLWVAIIAALEVVLMAAAVSSI